MFMQFLLFFKNLMYQRLRGYQDMSYFPERLQLLKSPQSSAWLSNSNIMIHVKSSTLRANQPKFTSPQVQTKFQIASDIKQSNDGQVNLESSVQVLRNMGIFKHLAIRDLKELSNSRVNPRLQAEKVFLYRLWEFINQQSLSTHEFVGLIQLVCSDTPIDSRNPVRLLRQLLVKLLTCQSQRVKLQSVAHQNQQVSTERKTDGIRKLDLHECKNLINRLYDPEHLIRKQQQKADQQVQNQLAQLDKCTFKPKLNLRAPGANKQNNPSQVSGYAQAISRLRKATHSKQDLKQKLQHIPCGQKLESLKSAPFNPPEMLQRPKGPVRAKLLFAIQFNIGKNKFIKVNVHQNQKAATIAKNTGRAYSLSKALVSQIEEVVKLELQNYKNMQALDS